ncbi:MAG: hypothetical protein ABI878_13525 [Acidobacteriota bacterium]
MTASKQTTDGGDPGGYTTGYRYALSTVSRRHDAARLRMQNNTQLTELSAKALKQYRQGTA